VADPVVLAADFTQNGEEVRPVGIVFENILAPIAPGGDVIKRPRKLQPQRPRHAPLPDPTLAAVYPPHRQKARPDPVSFSDDCFNRELSRIPMGQDTSEQLGTNQ